MTARGGPCVGADSVAFAVGVRDLQVRVKAIRPQDVDRLDVHSLVAGAARKFAARDVIQEGTHRKLGPHHLGDRDERCQVSVHVVRERRWVASDLDDAGAAACAILHPLGPAGGLAHATVEGVGQAAHDVQDAANRVID